MTRIAEQKRAERNLLGQRQILERVATGAPLTETLDELMLFIQSQEPGTISGILLTEDGVHFRLGSGPDIPPAYKQALHEAIGSPVPPADTPTCPEAARCDRITLVSDVAKDERYPRPWRDLMLGAGLRAVRLTPIRGSDGKVIGRLALYFAEPRDPNSVDPGVVDLATQLAAIAIERDRADKALAAELAATKELQSISTELVRDQGVQTLYDKLVEAAAAIMRSDCASMQVLDPGRSGGELRLVAQRGFDPRAFGFWEWVGPGRKSTCGMMLCSSRRVIAPDILDCDAMTGSAEWAAYCDEGIRAAQSTPLVSRSGRLLGAISTHWKKPHHPPESELQRLDVLARQAADLIERANAEEALRESERRFKELLEALPAAVYTTDAAGRITYYNQAAVALAGREPRLGSDEWCVTWRMYRPDGTPLPHDECPMAVALRENRPIRGEEAIAERPDGTRVHFLPSPTPLRDSSGAVTGGVNMLVDITERKRARDALQEREGRLRAIFSSTAIGIAVLTPKLRFIQVNDAFCAITGYSRDDLAPRDCRSLTHPDDVPATRELIDRLLAGRAASVTIEKRYIRKDGAPIWVQNSVSLVRDSAGRPLHLVALCEDVTDRKRAAEAMRQSREDLQAAMAASDTGTFRWDPHTGRYLEFDDNLKRLFGFAPGEPVRVTEDFIARVHPDDVPALTAAVDACRGGADFSMEYRVVLPDGGIRWLYDRARMERDAAGKPLYLVGACTDVTKRRQAEEQLRANEEHFRNLADTIPHLAWMAEPDGSIAWFNRGWYDYTGTMPEEMVGWGWQAVHDPRVLPEVLARWHASLTSGAPFEMVYPIRGADGVFRPFLTRVAPMRDGAGAIVRWFGTNTDISGQREIQDTLARLTEMLERELASRTRALEAEMAERQKVEAALQQAQRLEAIGQLTGGVAHDFNNLLTVVLGQTEAIAMATDGNDRIRSMAIAAQRAAERGAQLTDQLLSFSGRQQLRPVTVAIDGLLRGIGDLVRRTIGETIIVDLAVPAGLWASRLDPAQFESAILNLAINARDAMPDGGDLRIDARNAVVTGATATQLDVRPGEYVLVQVIDTGTGMAPEVARRAFEPFFTTKDIGKGTGLGLSQIYGFARQSGGTAVLDSAPGTGTTVSLYLPRAEIAGAALEAAAKAAAPCATGGATVLLVEDQADVREVTEMLLEELGYRVLSASDGMEARRLLASDEPIDLLLTDVVMPNGLSGIELAEEARRLRQELRIVIVSGYLRDGNPNAALSSGMIFLEKPFRQSELAETLALALGRQTAAGAPA